MAVAAISPHRLERIDSASGFKYEVDLTSLSAEGLDVAPGTLVSFVWRRHGKVVVSDVAEVDGDGSVLWDGGCTQVCTLSRESGSGWMPKPCELQVQAVMVDATGRPSCEGPVLASAPLDISHYCAAEALRPRGLALELPSGGTLHLRIASRWLPAYAGAAGTEPSSPSRGGEAESELSLSPATSTASLSTDAEPSVLARGYASSAHTPSTRQDSRGERSPVPAEDAYSCPRGGRGEGGEAFRTPTRRGSASPSPSEAPPTCSSGAGSEEGGGGDAEALARRCKRLARERDEARAEAFAEASVAVQRGIEIEDLKRAKATLLRRLESTESQLLMMMRLDMEASPLKRPAVVVPPGPAPGAVADAPAPAASAPDAEAFFVGQLVEAKVALAEKEFEAMELQGKLRAREAALAAMTEHLAAVRAEAEQRRRKAGGSALRRGKRSASPQDASTPALSPGGAAAGVDAAAEPEVTPPKAHSLAAAMMAMFTGDHQHGSGGKKALAEAQAPTAAGEGEPAASRLGGKRPVVGVMIQAHAGPVDVE